VKILAFDTATPATAVALAGFGDRALEARDDPAPGERPGHAARLLPLIAKLLSEAEAGWDELDRIAVGTGPGTFTGLRIGVATARALALASSLSLVGVSTLESLARAAREQLAAGEHDVVLAVIDARRREAFAAGWRTDGGALVLEPAALGAQALAERVRALAETPVAVGDGALAFRAVLESAGALVPANGSDLHRVTAAVHAEIARERPASDPDDVQPEYIRLPDAELARRAAR
jgi:tRNA threonylcarbamoyladenosine biosynthesis protein TsaB